MSPSRLPMTVGVAEFGTVPLVEAPGDVSVAAADDAVVSHDVAAVDAGGGSEGVDDGAGGKELEVRSNLHVHVDVGVDEELAETAAAVPDIVLDEDVVVAQCGSCAYVE